MSHTCTAVHTWPDGSRWQCVYSDTHPLEERAHVLFQGGHRFEPGRGEEHPPPAAEPVKAPPSFVEQVTGMLPANTHHAHNVFGGEWTWSTPRGLWVIKVNSVARLVDKKGAAVTVLGPGIELKFSTASELVLDVVHDLLAAYNAIDSEDDDDQPDP